MSSRPLLVLLLLTGLAHAHSVPIPPSLCSLDPLSFGAPATGLEATAAPAGPADVFRIVYDPGTSAAQLCAADPADAANRCAALTPERSFSGGGVSGTLRLAPFAARLLASGDLRAASASFSLTVASETDAVAMPLTTGLVAAGDAVAEGSPIGADGRFVLVGSATFGALSPPLGGTPVLVRMTCVAAPAPDLDQFIASTKTTKVAGKISSTEIRLRVGFRAGAEASPPDFARPVLLRVSAGDASIGTLWLGGGLEPQGRRKLVGQTADGLGSVTLRRVRRARYKMSVRLPTAALPASASATPVEVAYEVGGLLSRATRTFRSGRRGLHAP